MKRKQFVEGATIACAAAMACIWLACDIGFRIGASVFVLFREKMKRKQFVERVIIACAAAMACIWLAVDIGFRIGAAIFILFIALLWGIAMVIKK